MSTFHCGIEVAAVASEPFVLVTAVVDTGAAYSWVPRDLSRLGVAATGTRQFLLADGRRIEREIAIVYFKLYGEAQPTVCVLGDRGSQPVLGSVTLEEFGLAADPLNRRLLRLPQVRLLLGHAGYF